MQTFAACAGGLPRPAGETLMRLSEEQANGRPRLVQLSFVSPLFGPGRRPLVECRDALCPDPSRAPRRAAEGKGGAAWRRDRSHAQRPLGREHGEDPPFARSEHRGAYPSRAVFSAQSLSTVAELSTA